MRTYTAWLFIAVSIFSFSQGLRASEIWLRVGEVRSLPAAPDAAIRIGTRGIVRVVESGHSIQVIGLKPGVTPVVIDKKAHMIHVSRASEKSFYVSLQEQIAKMKGLSLTTDVQPMEIHGTLLRFSDWTTIRDLARLHHGRYIFKAQALPDVAEEALRHFRQIAQARGLPILRFTADPRFTVHIPAGDKGLVRTAEDVFSNFGIQVQSSASDLMVQPLVRTQVILAELNRSQSQAFGIEWPSAYQAQILPKVNLSESLVANLKTLEARGQAQILASPNLLCRSGGEAKFHAGGEFPIRMVSRTTRDVIWKSHGVILNVKPKADFQGTISLEIETEISLLDMANAVDGVPALKTNRVKSHFDLVGKKTIALSGLIRQELGRSQEGLPLLSNIPVLGALFSSRQFRAEQSELVIFVTPEIQSSEGDTPVALPQGWVTHEW